MQTKLLDGGRGFAAAPNPIQSYYNDERMKAEKRGEMTIIGYNVRNVVQLLEGIYYVSSKR